MHTLSTIVCFVLFLACTSGFYLPGVPEKHFKKGEPVPLFVNKLTSVVTQLPYAYYDAKDLPFFCAPPKNHSKKHENLGEILRGDRIEASVYEITAGADITPCKTINKLPIVDSLKGEKCTHLDADSVKKLANKIKDKYRVQWIMDNLPAATVKYIQTRDGAQIKQYDTGFALGQDGENSVNNHVDIKVIYGPGKDEDHIVILAFEVTPSSKKYNYEAWAKLSDEDKAKGTCPTDFNEVGSFPIKPNGEETQVENILWTYSLVWELNEQIKWTERWDTYLKNTGQEIHWISIVNSMMIVLFLSGMVAMIMMRTLRADLRRYNSQDLADDEGETGWKLVHGDVFRPPRHPMALAVLIGSGVQVFGMTVVTMVFAALGFFSPSQRGMLVTGFLVLFVLMGVFAGYFSARCYKLFKGTHHKKNTIMTAFAFPGTIFIIFIILNISESAVHSTATPFGTVVSLMALWFGISVPLVFFGSNFGQRKQLPDDPVRTNQIPRQIPEQVWYMSPTLSILMGGILPFGAVFIELYFILTALWGNQLYYIFGFLLIVFIILVLTCAEITVVMCYFQLCAEDYHWWWRSFLTAGASAFYMFLYSIFYFSTTLHIEKFVSGLLYFGYTLIMTIAFFVLTGTIGFYACYFFVRKIYSSIHVD